ncbi:hypothetical protein NHX12_031016, partial [Muraenolepis orangiensis]
MAGQKPAVGGGVKLTVGRRTGMGGASSGPDVDQLTPELRPREQLSVTFLELQVSAHRLKEQASNEQASNEQASNEQASNEQASNVYDG